MAARTRLVVPCWSRGAISGTCKFVGSYKEGVENSDELGVDLPDVDDTVVFMAKDVGIGVLD